MTWSHALTLGAETLFVGFALLGLILTGVVIARAIQLALRRRACRQELSDMDKRAFDAIARYRRNGEL